MSKANHDITERLSPEKAAEVFLFVESFYKSFNYSIEYLYSHEEFEKMSIPQKYFVVKYLREYLQRDRELIEIKRIQLFSGKPLKELEKELKAFKKSLLDKEDFLFGKMGPKQDYFDKELEKEFLTESYRTDEDFPVKPEPFKKEFEKFFDFFDVEIEKLSASVKEKYAVTNYTDNYSENEKRGFSYKKRNDLFVKEIPWESIENKMKVLRNFLNDKRALIGTKYSTVKEKYEDLPDNYHVMDEFKIRLPLHNRNHPYTDETNRYENFYEFFSFQLKDLLTADQIRDFYLNSFQYEGNNSFELLYLPSDNFTELKGRIHKIYDVYTKHYSVNMVPDVNKIIKTSRENLQNTLREFLENDSILEEGEERIKWEETINDKCTLYSNTESYYTLIYPENDLGFKYFFAIIMFLAFPKIRKDYYNESSEVWIVDFLIKWGKYIR